MNINAQLVTALRKKKSWSQEELATASGLNPRTIQRIESDGVASLQSRKALAAAFDLEVRELEIPEKPVMRTYEYKAVSFKMKMLGMAQGKTADAITTSLNAEAAQGWRCVEPRAGLEYRQAVGTAGARNQ